MKRQSIAIIALFLGVPEKSVRAVALNQREDPAPAEGGEGGDKKEVPLNPNIPPSTTTLAVKNMTALFV